MDTRKHTVLIVDDMASNIEILSGVLGDEYEILFASNGQEALNVAYEQVPDMILLDVVMPDMDGYGVCTLLKADEKTRDIPVIFVTSMDQEDDESKGFGVGGIDYITKPLRSSIVRARVRNHLELKRYRDHLKVSSFVDALTGVPNRRRFDEALDSEWRRARRNQSPLSLLLMDIDFFKAYNDHYGHPAGDDCLRRLAQGMAEVVLRPADLLARYGGEEFVMLLPETDADGALSVANRVQKTVSQLAIPHAYSTVVGQITLSTGAATLVPTEALAPGDLIRCADELLYAAKRRGRNQVANRLEESLSRADGVS
ncbi:MAG: diguanylate cyclase response regulator [Chloroflexi bacterium RBG_16_57_8]|nr:MAG: diguanylate cyclase response regulator [Chloroflexi bacterium RBG_16_57_8]